MSGTPSRGAGYCELPFGFGKSGKASPPFLTVQTRARTRHSRHDTVARLTVEKRGYVQRDFLDELLPGR